MSEWLTTARMAMVISDEKTNRRREPIILRQFNLAQHLRNVGLSLLALLF